MDLVTTQLLGYFLILVGFGEEYKGWLAFAMAVLVASLMSYRWYLSKQEEKAGGGE
jgi:hypothetical protein